ncbi:YtxH domain-containing protein [Croceiramulus getboli]|nr:YtxH domain-containing protein [Flavobacteriaceae bacterium YJPT1-3]
MSSNTGNTLLALLTGAAIGAGVGILYAPDRGDKTRKKLKKNAQKAQEKLNKEYQKASAQLSEKAQTARTNFETKLEETLSNASYKADDILLAMENKLEDLRKQNAKLQKEANNVKLPKKV